jgi:hypothetical protein
VGSRPALEITKNGALDLLPFRHVSLYMITVYDGHFGTNDLLIDLLCLTPPLSTIFQLYLGGQFYW